MTEMPDVLKKIVEHKKVEVAEAKVRAPLADLKARVAGAEPTRGFQSAIAGACERGATAIIAEVKKGSPSKGVIRADFDPVGTARIYQENGATCISVLTDEKFFLGHLDYLSQIRRQVRLPLLRKDFICDPYQIFEARGAGADAILLIAAMLDLSQLRDLHALARELSLDVLLEVHDERELETALQTECRLIGINNRNLRTFVVDVSTSERLAALVPAGTHLVAESGITKRDEIVALQQKGLHAFLIGESLMREEDIGAKLRELVG